MNKEIARDMRIVASGALALAGVAVSFNAPSLTEYDYSSIVIEQSTSPIPNDESNRTTTFNVKDLQNPVNNQMEDNPVRLKLEIRQPGDIEVKSRTNWDGVIKKLAGAYVMTYGLLSIGYKLQERSKENQKPSA